MVTKTVLAVRVAPLLYPRHEQADEYWALFMHATGNGALGRKVGRSLGNSVTDVTVVVVVVLVAVVLVVVE